jgi:hypothetical protein
VKIQPPAPKQTETKTIDPVTLSDAPNVSGSGLASPIGGGGGGDFGSFPDSDTGTTAAGPGDEIQDGGMMPEVVVKNKQTNWLVIGVVAFVLMGLVFFLNRKK